MAAGERSQARVRGAIRQQLSGHHRGSEQAVGRGSRGLVLAAVSGGPDSLALAAGLLAEAAAAQVRTGCVIVDHGLQTDSAQVAHQAAEQCLGMRAPDGSSHHTVEVRAVEVPRGGDGPEGDARRARHRALDEAAEDLGAGSVLLGHTRDDQAEQVLLGLLRGAGTRSLAGIPPEFVRGEVVYRRPLLALARTDTEAACAAWGLSPWRDPHNHDQRFARVRARRALTDLGAALGEDLTPALARSAKHLREDADLLDELALGAVAGLGHRRETDGDGRTHLTVAAAALADHPRALRIRLWRLLLTEAGSPGGALGSTHLGECDRLVSDWRGQGPVHLPGDLVAERTLGWVSVRPRRRVE